MSEGNPVFISSEAAAAVFSWREAIDALAATYAASVKPSSMPPRAVGSDDGAWLRAFCRRCARAGATSAPS